MTGGNRHLEVLHTPGHAPGHICLFDPVDGTLFAGDMVAGVGTVVIDPTDGDLGDYLASLQRLIQVGPSVILPAHGPPIGVPRARLHAYLAHRRARSREILRVLESGPRTAGAIARHVYRGLPPGIARVGLRTVLAHLAYLEREGLVVMRGRHYFRTAAELG